MTADTLLLTPRAMAAVDAATIAGGVPGPRLMENAGRAVVRAITGHFAPCPTLVLCGPGNNGGDGWVVARRLRAAGWPVRLASLAERDQLQGDAATMAARWSGPVEEVAPEGLRGAALVVDALFGAGLARDLEGGTLAVVEALADGPVPVVAVDVPSGVDGATGAIRGGAPLAALTVTFGCRKPGHVLLPGALRCGATRVVDIGLAPAALAAQDEGLRVNTPALWASRLPRRTQGSHKYDFGHALVVGGPITTTGASRLCARAALRVGAGLVSIACPPETLPIYAATLTAVMTKPVADAAAMAGLLADPRLNALAFGPGAGVGATTRATVRDLLALQRPTVLDADALTSFADMRAALLERLHGQVVLTPHDGEFARIFAHRGCRLERARAAAAESRAVVVLKGNDTVVAAPDGRAAVLADAPAALATAGTGDVLTGLVLGLLAQAMPAFEAACAAVWLHAAAARALGGALIAEDLSEALPKVLTDLSR
jgi:hydroxyethylthiazole kinase-like uncharacterized protein yjeF